MDRATAIKRIKAVEPLLRKSGTRSLYLFGSTARNKARKTSDVDVCITYDPKSKFSLIELSGIKIILTRALKVKADVVTKDALRPEVRGTFNKDAVKVF